MAGTARMRPITHAEIEVVPWRDRVATLADSGVRLRPTLRSVEAAATDPSRYADNDVLVAMFAKLGCDTERSLVGSVMVSERARYPTASPAEFVALPSYERLIVIDGLMMTEQMTGWRPPLRTLLIATAAMIVATTAHDEAARTCVACRVDGDDVLGGNAVEQLGGRRLEGLTPRPAGLLPGSPRVDDLGFLGALSAARAAELVLAHLDGNVWPARSIGSHDAHAVEGMLSLRFPRPIRALREEIESIAGRSVEVDWRPPAIAINDLDQHLRRAANAAP